MTFKQYLKQLNTFAKNNPDALPLNVIYARDNEGNSFESLYYSPAMGKLVNGDFKLVASASPKNEKPNSVCIN